MYNKFNNLNDEKKKTIIKSAIEEFSQNGYHKASTDKIAANANIAKGSLFHYFGSKKKLYFYIVDYSMDFISEKVKEKCKSIDTTDFFERMKIVSLYKQSLFVEYPGETKITLDALKEDNNEIKSDLSKIINEYNSKNMIFLQEHVIKYMNKDDLKEDIEINDAIFMTMTMFEALSKKHMMLIETNQIILEDIVIANLFDEFDKYIKILKSGLYK